ncbi:MAG TPA: hypothetical protein VFR82_08960 [Nitrospira sp.]|nr:hypothetical protein [Nitrospira sp.]
MENAYKNFFEAECRELADLETFDPDAFVGDDAVPQSVCNFVLSLALIFNDLRDLYYANFLVGGCKPTGSVLKNKQWGYYSGLYLHIVRLILSAIHELLNLIEKQRADMDHPIFADVLKALPKDKRKEWFDVVGIALGKSSADSRLEKLLLRIRNNVSFHYDAKALYGGFRHHFLVHQPEERAYVSRGNTVQSTRFYFADAAVDGLLNEISGTNGPDLAASFEKLIDGVYQPVMLIISGFIQKRGCAFRQEPC